jgi:RNA polymerase sigma-70 factor (ECF subfamily)
LTENDGETPETPAALLTVSRGPNAFEAFFAEHRTGVLALMYTLTGERTAAEDLAQEAFTEAFRRWPEISRYEDPGAWVRRVAVNRSVSRFRRRRNEDDALQRAGGLRVVHAQTDEADDSFWAAVRTLPERQAQAVALFYLEDRSVAEIADVLGIASATVKVHLHRGRLALARTLGTEAREEQA